MYKTSSKLKLLRSRNCMFGIIVLVCFWIPAVSSAQQPTATINALTGEVFVSKMIPAKVGMVLRSGDMIQTQIGASAVLKLSDGSRLEIGEKSHIDIVKLVLKPLTKARISWMKLMWGGIRVTLSSKYQKPGSSFQVETPDILISMKASQPDIEVLYDPVMYATNVFKHTGNVMLAHLLVSRGDPIM